jgi:hypothetical protein
MKAMLLIYGSEDVWSALPAQDLEREMGAYMAFTEALIAAGKFVAGAQLQPVAKAESVNVGAGVAADDRARRLDGDDGVQLLRRLVICRSAIPAVVERFAAFALEAPRRVGDRAASFSWRLEHGRTVTPISEQNKNKCL